MKFYKKNRLYLTARDQSYIDCRKVPVPFYPVELYIGISKTDAATGAPDNGLAGFVTTDTNNNQQISIVIREDYIDNVTTVSHECFHVKEAIEDVIGERLTGEAGAYLTGWINDTVNTELQKQLKYLKPQKPRKRTKKCKNQIN